MTDLSKLRHFSTAIFSETKSVTSLFFSFLEGGKGGIVIPFHAQILTKFTRHVLNQSLSEGLNGGGPFDG